MHQILLPNTTCLFTMAVADE